MTALMDQADRAYSLALDRHMPQARVEVALIMSLADVGERDATVMRWIDRTKSLIGIPQGRRIGFEMTEDSTGAVIHPDLARPEMAWSARLFVARCNGDQTTVSALMAGLMVFSAATAELYVYSLLHILTTTALAVMEQAEERRTYASLDAYALISASEADARRAAASLN